MAVRKLVKLIKPELTPPIIPGKFMDSQPYSSVLAEASFVPVEASWIPQHRARRQQLQTPFSSKVNRHQSVNFLTPRPVHYRR